MRITERMSCAKMKYYGCPNKHKWFHIAVILRVPSLTYRVIYARSLGMEKTFESWSCSGHLYHELDFICGWIFEWWVSILHGLWYFGINTFIVPPIRSSYVLRSSYRNPELPTVWRWGQSPKRRIWWYLKLWYFGICRVRHSKLQEMICCPWISRLTENFNAHKELR